MRTIYQNQDDNDPSIAKTIHRNHLVEYHHKEESLAAMNEKDVPPDQRHVFFILDRRKTQWKIKQVC